MAEKDPRDYRGGVHEADNEGIVPREMVDDPGAPPPERSGDDQALSDAALGGVTDRDPTDDAIDHSGGDEADATAHSGTGADAEEVKEEMEEDKPVSWVQGANVARGEG
jgi:hypothetical protein